MWRSVWAVVVLVGACTTADISPPEPECLPDSPNLASGSAATASSSSASSAPANVIDADEGTAWIAGGDPDQWIEIDLGEPTPVRCVRLLVRQEDSAMTSHRVNGGAHDNPGRQIGELTGETTSGEWLEIEGDWEFQFLRVTTTSSAGVPPSWFEIEVR